MTVQSTTARADYQGNNVTTTFVVPFYFLDNSHVKVVRTDNSTSPPTTATLVLGPDYVLTGAGVQIGGQIQTTVAPTASQVLTVLRNVPFTQLIHYVPNDPFPAATHEQALDQLTMEVQELNEGLTHAIQFPTYEPVPAALPPAATRANQLLGFGPTGQVQLSPITASVGAGDLRVEEWVDGTGYTSGTSNSVTLSRAYGTKANLGSVVMQGIAQDPNSYTLSGTTLTFNAVIPAGISAIWCTGGTTLSTSVPPNQSVGDAQLSWGLTLTRTVASCAALALLDVTLYQRALATGARVTGDGGGGQYWYDPTLPAASADGFIAVAGFNGTGCWRLIVREWVSVIQAGAFGDGASDDTVFFRAAAATGYNVYVPATTNGYVLTNSVTFSRISQRVFGDGRFKTKITIPPAFNMAAVGVFVSGAICVEYVDLAIVFTQPDTSVKANITQYPAAIAGIGQPGQRIRRCRIEAAWVAVDWRDNCGQSSIDDLIYSTLNVGIWLDGAVDTVRLNDLHCWPSGLTTNQTTLMTTNVSVYGVLSGRMDDLKVSNGLFYVAMPFNFFSGTRANAGPTIGAITDCDLDGFGGIVMNAGTITVTGGLQTGGTLSTVKLNQSGGVINYVGVNFQVAASFPASAFSSFLNLSGTAVCSITGGSIYKPTDACVVNVAAGQFTMTGIQLVHQANATFLLPFIQVGGAGQVTATGNNCSPLGAGAQIFFSALTDGSHRISQNTFYGHTITAPTGTGYYGGNSNAIGNTEIYNNMLTGDMRVMRLVGTTDGSGNFTAAHGIGQAQQKVLGAQAFFRGASGEAKPMTISSVDGTNVVCTGGTATSRCRVVIQYSQAADAW